MKKVITIIAVILLVGCTPKTEVVNTTPLDKLSAETFGGKQVLLEGKTTASIGEKAVTADMEVREEADLEVMETAKITSAPILSILPIDDGLEEDEEKAVIQEVTIAVTGDLMFHASQLEKSYDETTEQFDFNDTFEMVLPYLQEADLTVGNLETTIAGPYEAWILGDPVIAGYTGYPCFNTPDSVIDSINEAGFDLLTTANNHSLDSGYDGLVNTLDLLDMNGLLHVGTYRTKAESEQFQSIEINGMTFIFISMTYATNGLPLPEEAPFCVNTLDYYNGDKEEAMCQLVRDARALNPDFIVVMPHYGTEYMSFQDSNQESFTNKLLEAGADIVLGSHPHVLEPIEIKEVVREDGTREKCFVIYSLGNFISSQKASTGKEKDLGVILELNFTKEGLEEPQLEGFSLVPTYTYWSDETIGVAPVEETLDKINAHELILSDYDVNRLTFAQTYAIDHLMSYMDDYTVEYENYHYYVCLEE
jgi:poly-gamma-glutamate synthesis protein (capsule biosynthesis protein)